MVALRELALRSGPVCRLNVVRRSAVRSDSKWFGAQRASTRIVPQLLGWLASYMSLPWPLTIPGTISELRFLSIRF